LRAVVTTQMGEGAMRKKVLKMIVETVHFGVIFKACPEHLFIEIVVLIDAVNLGPML